MVVVLEVLDGATELELLQSRSSKEPGDQRNNSDPHFNDKPSLSRLDLFYDRFIGSNSHLCLKPNSTKGLLKKNNNKRNTLKLPSRPLRPE